VCCKDDVDVCNEQQKQKLFLSEIVVKDKCLKVPVVKGKCDLGVLLFVISVSEKGERRLIST